jgi:hypothetical protein
MKIDDRVDLSTLEPPHHGFGLVEIGLVVFTWVGLDA